MPKKQYINGLVMILIVVLTIITISIINYPRIDNNAWENQINKIDKEITNEEAKEIYKDIQTEQKNTSPSYIPEFADEDIPENFIDEKSLENLNNNSYQDNTNNNISEKELNNNKIIISNDDFSAEKHR